MEKANCSIDIIYVSPLKRAQETLKAALEQLGCTTPIRINSHLREIDLPAWEGLSFAQVKTDFSLDIQDFLGNALGLAPEHLWRLHLSSGNLSVLHYPSSQQRPVLQTTNFLFSL